MPSVNKKAVVSKECVACGVCVKECPTKAIAVYRGLYAKVSAGICVGCGKCAKVCPAGVIEIRAAEGNL